MDRDFFLSLALTLGLIAGVGGGYSAYMASRINATPSGLAGTWAGESRDGGRAVGWRLDSFADGRFTIEFRSYTVCHQFEVMNQTGHWSARWPFHHMHVETIDGEERDITNTYLVVWLSDTSTAYIFTNPLAAFSSRRVAPDYQFEGCFAAERAESESRGNSLWRN